MLLILMYYVCFMLLIHPELTLTNKCYECNTKTFNYTITIDNIPSPTDNDCEIVDSDDGCFARIGWFEDGTSEVYYSGDPALPSNSIATSIQRRVITWTGQYTTKKFISYSCKVSNGTPCNTLENLKRSIISTTLPSDDQIEKFDKLIVPTTDFDGRSCLQRSNMSDCANANILLCQQCLGIIQYTENLEICATCPSGKAVANFIDLSTTFLLDSRARIDTITLACRRIAVCNSIENLSKIKETIFVQFDYDKFYRSTGIKNISIIFFPLISLFFHLVFIDMCSFY